MTFRTGQRAWRAEPEAVARCKTHFLLSETSAGDSGRTRSESRAAHHVDRGHDMRAALAAAMVPAMVRKRMERVVSTKIDEAELTVLLARGGLKLTPDQVRAILPGAEIVREMIARINAPLPREAEPALTFDVEQK